MQMPRLLVLLAALAAVASAQVGGVVREWVWCQAHADRGRRRTRMAHENTTTFVFAVATFHGVQKSKSH